jgi:hypothetical protein
MKRSMRNRQAPLSAHDPCHRPSQVNIDAIRTALRKTVIATDAAGFEKQPSAPVSAGVRTLSV